MVLEALLEMGFVAYNYLLRTKVPDRGQFFVESLHQSLTLTVL